MKTRRYRKAEEPEQPEAQTLSDLKREVLEMMRSIEITPDDDDDEDEDDNV